MLVTNFAFKAPQSEEKRLQSHIAKLSKDYSSESEEGEGRDDLPVVVDLTEKFIKF